MENYIPMLDLQRHRNEAKNHVLERIQPATQRHRCNFRISLESLWLASSSDSTQPRRGGNLNGETTMRQSDFKTHRLGEENEVPPNDEPWYERHMEILDPHAHRAKRGKRPKDITAIVDYKETVQRVSVDANQLKDPPTGTPYRQSFSRREHCSFRINNRSATPQFFSRSNSKHTWKSRGGSNIPYTGNIRLPKLRSHDTTFKISNNDSPHSRVDITIAASPRERLFVQKPTHLPQRNLNNDRRRLPSLDIHHRGSQNPNHNNQDRKSNDKNINSNSLDHDEEHISSFIKVSVTIANAVTPEGTPTTSTEAHSLQQQNSKTSDHFTSEVLSGYSNTKEFIESTNRLHTPPRPHIVPISSSTKKKENSCEPYLKIEPLEKRHLSTVGEEDASINQIENTSCSANDQKEEKIAVTVTKKEKASQTTSINTKNTKSLTKAKRPPNKEIQNQETHEDVKAKEQTNEKAPDSDLALTHSARSYESKTSGDRGVASSVESDMLTTYQRQRLASIWRNSSLATGNKGSTGYTPSVESHSASFNGSQDHSLASFLSTAQCAVCHFPVRESRRFPQDRGVFKRRLGRIIPRMKSLDHSSVVGNSDISFEEEHENDEELQKEPIKFVECVNVASMILKKKKKKRKPTIYLPKVTVKKSKKRLKGNSAISKDSRTVLPPLLPLSKKTHSHTNSKDCECDECGRKKVKKGKSKKSPGIKGLPKIAGASPRSRKFNSVSEGDQGCDILERFTNEADRLLWVSEQQSEKLYVYPGYVPPRIILLSSKLGKLNSAREMMRKDTKGLLLIPYDFENWNFTDLLDSISLRLKEYHFGSRAKSILFLCQGGPGYAYILKNFVVTPQKLKRKDYKPLVQFLKLLGAVMSKVNPEDTAIHFLGFNMTVNKQGRELVKSVKKCTLPNIVKVESPLENSIEERMIANLYFDHNAFMAWKAEEKEEHEAPRSWSSLAV